MFTPNEYGLFSMPTLETPRLTLRRMTMKDAKDVFEYSRDADVARHVLWSAQKDIGEAKDYCRYMTRRYRADDILEHIDFVYLLCRRRENEYRFSAVLRFRFRNFDGAAFFFFCPSRCGERADEHNRDQNN